MKMNLAVYLGVDNNDAQSAMGFEIPKGHNMDEQQIDISNHNSIEIA